MARLDILFHQGCLSEQTARGLAREVQDELPNWEIRVSQLADEETVSFGIVVFPAFVLEGKLLAAGIPKKEWLVAKLKEWERGKNR
ncbi:MAG: hypothetical protein ACREI2_12610 [Nitrospiraceae bacterium]